MQLSKCKVALLFGFAQPGWGGQVDAEAPGSWFLCKYLKKIKAVQQGAYDLNNLNRWGGTWAVRRREGSCVMSTGVPRELLFVSYT